MTKLTAKQAASFYGIPVSRLYAWCRKEQVPHVKMPSGHIYFYKEKLESFEAGREFGPAVNVKKEAA